MDMIGILTAWVVGAILIYRLKGFFHGVFMRTLRFRGQDSETMRKEDLAKGLKF